MAATGGTGGSDVFELWPHRSLGRKGTVVLLGAVILGFAFVIVATTGLGSWPVPTLAMATGLGMGIALWQNNRAVLSREVVEVTPRVIRVTRLDAGRPSAPVEFNAHWVRIEVLTDRQIEDRIVLREGRRRLSLGNFLSPPERIRLAAALRESVSAQRSMGD